tara:strand:+ start:471 stop:1100 length:630 start_codon:yes stop_codon:yes gene_type:complete
MGWLSDKLFGKRKKVSVQKIKEYMQPTQNMITNQASNLASMMESGMGQADEQLGLGREFMDIYSDRNVGMRGLLKNIATRQASDQGAQIGSSMMKMGAMSGVSPGQAMMQSRMAQNQAMGGIGSSLLQSALAQMQGATQQGIGLMGQGLGHARSMQGVAGLQSGLIGMQQGLDENQANMYIGNINAANARRASNQAFGQGLLGSFLPGG